MWHISEYNGWSSWETWETYNIISSEEKTYDRALRFARLMDLPGFEQWTIQFIVGPYNQERQQEAHEWNTIPPPERLDYTWENLNSQNPQAADLVNQMGFGPDVSDMDLNDTLIIESKIDWAELFRHFAEDYQEQSDWKASKLAAPGEDSWTHPRSDHLEQNVEMPGNAPGLNPEGSLEHLKRPCYCDTRLSCPHEWSGSCEKGLRPTFQHEANIAGANWLYLNGKVAMGRHWWELAEQLADEHEMDDQTKQYISNLIARNSLPSDQDIAAGTIRNGKPSIWASSIDRNHVYDSVVDHHRQQQDSNA